MKMLSFLIFFTMVIPSFALHVPPIEDYFSTISPPLGRVQFGFQCKLPVKESNEVEITPIVLGNGLRISKNIELFPVFPLLRYYLTRKDSVVNNELQLTGTTTCLDLGVYGVSYSPVDKFVAYFRCGLKNKIVIGKYFWNENTIGINCDTRKIMHSYVSPSVGWQIIRRISLTSAGTITYSDYTLSNYYALKYGRQFVITDISLFTTITPIRRIKMRFGGGEKITPNPIFPYILFGFSIISGKLN